MQPPADILLPKLDRREMYKSLRIDSESPELYNEIYRHPFSPAIHSPLISPREETVTTPPFTFKQALKTLIINTLPLIMVYLALFSVRNLSLHFVKDKFNNRITSAVGVGNTLLNVFGLAVFMSLNTGLVSRSSQAYGAKNYQLVGNYLHRGLIINTLALIPGSCLFYWADSICILLGFDPETATLIQQLTSYCILGVYGMMVFNTLSSYLYSCDIFFPSSVALIISTIVFWILSYLLFQNTDMDLLAIAISYNVMQVLAAVLVFLYIMIKNPVPRSFFWFKRSSFKGIWRLFKYEFLVGSMMFLEWISLEIIYLFAGRLNVIELSSLTIVYTNFQTLYAVPVSLADTVLAFMGNAMGEGNLEKAKNFLKAGLFWSMVSLILVEFIYIFLSGPIAEFYTADQTIIQETINIFRVYLFYYPPDFVQIILSSGLRSVGKEKLGSTMFIVCYYIIAIPLAYVLCFEAGLKNFGLVYGPLIGLYFLFTWLFISYWRLDWDKQLAVIQKRIKKDHKTLCE